MSWVRNLADRLVRKVSKIFYKEHQKLTPMSSNSMAKSIKTFKTSTTYNKKYKDFRLLKLSTKPKNNLLKN